MALVKVTNISKAAVGASSFFLRKDCHVIIDEKKITAGEIRLQQKGLITIEPAAARDPIPTANPISERVVQPIENIPVREEVVEVEEPLMTVSSEKKDEMPKFASIDPFKQLPVETDAPVETAKSIEEPKEPLFYSREQLEAMKMSDLRDINKAMGLQKSKERGPMIEGILLKQQEG